MIRVCLAGATGWAGSELARGIARVPDIAIVSAVSRSSAGHATLEMFSTSSALMRPSVRPRSRRSATPATFSLSTTKPDSAKSNILAALERGAHVVVGTSGLTEGDFAEIDVVARRQGRGVLASATSR